MTTNALLWFGLVALVAALLLALGPRRDAAAGPGDDVVTFERDIKPVIHNYCTTCHAGSEPEGGFVLGSYADVRKHTEQGTLLARLEDAENPMPPAGRLPINHRRLFRAWAEQGYPKGTPGSAKPAPALAAFKPPTITPVDVRKEGFEFVARMQGHWVGSMWLMGQDFEWFAFDYRAIGPSTVHGLFEGGTIGNLFTTFFVADLRGVPTLMARNGGVLNGLYRTSYFVLDRVTTQGGESRYRFVDAYGGAGIMWMEVRFQGDTIHFESHTSRMGVRGKPTLHMRFKGTRRSTPLAAAAAKAHGFPKNEPAYAFPKGLPKASWGPKHTVTSASYMWQQEGKSLGELGKLSGDPIRVDQVPFVGRVTLRVKRPSVLKGRKLQVFFSEEPLTDEAGRLRASEGYLRPAVGDTILLFSELGSKEDSFEFTYLHPGTYYLTVVGDMDGDEYPGPGDLTHTLRKIVVTPGGASAVSIDGLAAR